MTYRQADIYDAVAVDDWGRLGPHAVDALSPWASTTGVAVDLGAGSGLSTALVARQCPEAEVLACEPDAGLRAALMTRVVCTGMRDRVTVLPWAASDLAERMAEPIDVFTAFNMLGHLSSAERAGLWDWLSTSLRPTGLAVIGPIAGPDTTSCPETETPFVASEVGRRRYTGSSRCEVVDEGEVIWHMSWRVYDGEVLVDERSQSFRWQRPRREDVLAELARVGLHAEIRPGDLLRISQPGHRT